MSPDPSSFGPFKILREIGHGGMGLVHMAEDAAGRRVALKIVPEHLSKNEMFRLRFQRECAVLRKLDFSGIPRLYDQGEHDGRLYLTMEYADGHTLERIASNQPDRMRHDWIQTVLQAVAEILAYAHELGVIHRDISPKNILVTRTNGVKLIDFGISKVAAEVTLTLTGHHLGTPAYMAPEHFSSVGTKEVDNRADLWSVGVVAFWMLTGRRPFEANNHISLIRMITHPNAVVPRIQTIHPFVSPRLASVVDRLLEKNPADRYQTAMEVVTALTAVKEVRTYVPRPSMTRTAARRRRKCWFAILGGGVMTTLGLAIWNSWDHNGMVGKDEDRTEIVHRRRVHREGIPGVRHSRNEEGSAFYRKGRELEKKAKYEGAVTAYHTAIHLYERENNTRRVVSTSQYLIRVLAAMNRHEEAAEARRKLIQIVGKMHTPSQRAQIHMGLALMELKDDTRAVDILRNTAVICEKSGYHKLQALSYAGLVRALTGMGQIDEARLYAGLLRNIEKKSQAVFEVLKPLRGLYPDIWETSLVADTSEEEEETSDEEAEEEE